MRKTNWCLFFIFLFFYCGQANGLGETMYVTDRLFLSLRNAPDLEQPSMMLLPSTTKVDVLQTEGQWAEVMLEDGKPGWVLKKYLVEHLHSSRMVEELKAQLTDKDHILERLREESASLQKEISTLATERAKTASLKKEIEDLKARLIEQKETLEKAKAQYKSENRKIVYGTGFLALLAGLITGFLLRRPGRGRYYLR